MASPAEKPLPIVEAFDEKQFYLDEFRGRTLLFSVPVEELKQDDDYERLAAIVRELLTNDARVLVLVEHPMLTAASKSCGACSVGSVR